MQVGQYNKLIQHLGHEAADGVAQDLSKGAAPHPGCLPNPAPSRSRIWPESPCFGDFPIVVSLTPRWPATRALPPLQVVLAAAPLSQLPIPSFPLPPLLGPDTYFPRPGPARACFFLAGFAEVIYLQTSPELASFRLKSDAGVA